MRAAVATLCGRDLASRLRNISFDVSRRSISPLAIFVYLPLLSVSKDDAKFQRNAICTMIFQKPVSVSNQFTAYVVSHRHTASILRSSVSEEATYPTETIRERSCHDKKVPRQFHVQPLCRRVVSRIGSAFERPKKTKLPEKKLQGRFSFEVSRKPDTTWPFDDRPFDASHPSCSLFSLFLSFLVEKLRKRTLQTKRRLISAAI